MSEKILETEPKEIRKEFGKWNKLYTISMTVFIIILFIGFIFMSLIVVDIINQTSAMTKEFIEFISRFI